MLGSRGSSWTSYGDHSFFGFRLPLMITCVERLPLMFICILHELYLRLVFGFEPWFVMCDELCEFVLLLSIYVHLVVVRLC